MYHNTFEISLWVYITQRLFCGVKEGEAYFWGRICSGYGENM